MGTPVALLVDEEEQVAAFKGYAAPAGSSGAGAAVATVAPGEAAAAAPASSSSGMAPGAPHHSDRMGPAARTLLAESGLSPDDVTPTGPHGIITKGDVLAAIAAGVKPRAAAAAAPPAAAPQAAPQQQQQPAAAAQQQAAAAPKPAPAAAAAAAPVAAPRRPAKGAAYTDIPNSQIRKIIAQRLQESKQSIPHL